MRIRVKIHTQLVFVLSFSGFPVDHPISRQILRPSLPVVFFFPHRTKWPAPRPVLLRLPASFWACLGFSPPSPFVFIAHSKSCKHMFRSKQSSCLRYVSLYLYLMWNEMSLDLHFLSFFTFHKLHPWSARKLFLIVSRTFRTRPMSQYYCYP